MPSHGSGDCPLAYVTEEPILGDLAVGNLRVGFQISVEPGVLLGRLRSVVGRFVGKLRVETGLNGRGASRLGVFSYRSR